MQKEKLCQICDKEFEDVLIHMTQEHTIASIKCRNDGKRLDEHSSIELNKCLEDDGLDNPYDEN